MSWTTGPSLEWRDGLTHEVIWYKSDGSPDGEDTLRVMFRCGKRIDLRTDPYLEETMVTCIACWGSSSLALAEVWQRRTPRTTHS